MPPRLAWTGAGFDPTAWRAVPARPPEPVWSKIHDAAHAPPLHRPNVSMTEDYERSVGGWNGGESKRSDGSSMSTNALSTSHSSRSVLAIAARILSHLLDAFQMLFVYFFCMYRFSFSICAGSVLVGIADSYSRLTWVSCQPRTCRQHIQARGIELVIHHVVF